MGGRAAVIVPDGVLFGSSQAHLGVRQMLVDDNQLEAVISLPAGVFKPYAGVSTAILVFTKGGRTDDVWFYDVRGRRLLPRRQTHPPARQERPAGLVVKRWKDEGGRMKAKDRPPNTSSSPSPTSAPTNTTSRSTATRRPSTRKPPTTHPRPSSSACASWSRNSQGHRDLEGMLK
jgi:hypothetical protein